MRRISLNEGWSVRPKANRWSDITGDSAEWSPVTLPHDAVIAAPRDPEVGPATGYYPGGVWEYHRTLDVVDEDLDAMLVLEFEGVYRDAFVTVNETAAAHRPYGYSRFFVPIGPFVRAGENEILVVATAHDDSRWYSGGGIHRNVWLHRGGALHVVPDGIAVTTPEIDDDVATVVIEVEVANGSNRSAAPTVRIELTDAGGAVVAADEAPVSLFPATTISVHRRLPVHRPRRWGLDDPYRYSCRVTVSLDGEVVDEASTAFGIRALTLDAERGLRLNGEPIVLRGTCVHHDNGLLGAASIDRAEHRRVELLKAAGFNAIRSAHNPASRGMLDACDRLGMLVMDETFDMWTQTKSDDDYALRFSEWWEADVEAMVRRDRNHPSVIMYCTGNEITDGATPSGEQVARAIAARFRALDPTRYVVQAVSGLLAAGYAVFDDVRAAIDPESGVNAALTDLGDLLARAMRSPLVDTATAETYSGLDISGYNYMEARYDLDVERYPHRMMVATESHPSRIDLCWAGVTDHPQVVGDFTWTGWDYLGEAGVGRVEHGDTPMTGFLGAYPWRTAWCGDIDITGERRPQSYYREVVWGLRPDPYLAVRRPEYHGRSIVYASPWAWSDSVGSWSWPGYEDASVVVEVYADADDVEVFQDGESIGRAPVGREHGYRAEFETVYRPGTLEAVAWRDGVEIGRCELRSAVGDVRLGLRAERDVIVAEPTDLAYVAIELVDAAGVRFTGVDRLVQVVVEGPGVLQGLGSANPCTEEGFVATECTTFDGRALAVVRPTGPGTLTVTATAEGCAACHRVDRRTRAGTMSWELRWHPFRAEWVLFTSHRGARPWIGEVVAHDEPVVPAENALAPLGQRIDTTNPDYRGVFVFTNDLPVFGPDAPEPISGDDLYRARRAVGTAEVVCYHHDPAKSMADLDDDEATAVVITWRERTRALQALDGVAHVHIFENRGAAVGTSNPHPHCQIYAGALVYATIEREASVAAEHHRQTGRALIADVAARELAGPRVTDEGEHFFACVPWFARYAYEVHVLPRVATTSLLDLDDDRCRSLALVLRAVVRRYDALWGIQMPYVLAVHQAPVGDHPYYPFHVELHPPLRAPGLLKYLAGPEVGGGSMTNESDPDEKAAELRGALA